MKEKKIVVNGRTARWETVGTRYRFLAADIALTQDP